VTSVLITNDRQQRDHGQRGADSGVRMTGCGAGAWLLAKTFGDIRWLTSSARQSSDR
jgi:hypothetical protein